MDASTAALPPEAAPAAPDMLAEARARPELWRLGLGLVVALMAYLSVLALQALMLLGAVGQDLFFLWVGRLTDAAEPVPTLMLLSTFAGFLLGPVLAAAALHFRPARTLFGGWRAVARDFGRTVRIALPLYALLIGASFLVARPAPNLPWDTWLRYLPLALPLLLLQVTAEEVLFRGYLQSQLAVRFAARWVAYLLPSALFAVLHWNPEAGGLAAVIVAATFAFALIAADLTRRSGNLGAAIGLHFVNNLFALLVVSMTGTITGLARWTTPDLLDQPPLLLAATAVNILFLTGVWWVLKRRLPRAPA